MAARAHFRCYARQPAKLLAVVTGYSGTWERRARVVNLSLGGACLELAEVPPVGSRLGVRIDAPHLWDPLILGARVVWTTQLSPLRFKTGIQFDQHSAASVRSLADLLAARTFE
jgi:hypothetical protein